jgi:hypothetical protein
LSPQVKDYLNEDRDEADRTLRGKLVCISQIPEEDERMAELKKLAKEVGAGTEHTKIVGTSSHNHSNGGRETTIYQNPISESELVQNIHNALQTKTIIVTCQTANKNVWIAIVSVIIACLSVFAAFLSALAAWVAIFCKRV